jgi:rhodanese-related sulfurtransferase
VNEVGRALRQALALGALSVLVAAIVHFPLIARFARGEFRDSFFQASDYPGLRLITIEEGEELWRAGGTVFIDARRKPAFDEGHVPAALSAPAAEAEKALPMDVRTLPRGQAVVVYCEGGDCQSSLLLAHKLSQQGFKDVRVMTGGFGEWTKAGLPAERGHGQE